MARRKMIRFTVLGWVLLLTFAAATLNGCSSSGGNPQASRTPVRTATPKPLSSVTYDEILSHRQNDTEAQWAEYQKGLIGLRVRWSGWVEQVQESGAILIDMEAPDVPLSWQEVRLPIPAGDATKYNKDEKLTWEGDLQSVVGALSGVAIFFDNVVIVPATTRPGLPTHTPKPTSVVRVQTSTPTSSSTLTAVADSRTPVSENSPDCSYGMAYISDVTIPDGTQFDPGVEFVKTWAIKNTGTCRWDSSSFVAFSEGEQMDGDAHVAVPEANPGDVVQVSVTLRAPASPGQHQGVWQLCTSGGCYGSVTVVIQTRTSARAATPTQSGAEVPTSPTSVAPVLEFLSHTSYSDGAWYFIVGEIRNNSTQPMASVKIVATLYDGSGNVVGTDYTYTELDVIPPGGKSPFETGTDQWEGATNYRLQVQGSSSEPSREDVVIKSHTYHTDGDWLIIVGEVENTGRTDAESVRIIITLYDAGGDVVGLDYTYAALDTIPPGETSPFEAGTDHWPRFDHYEIQVQAR